MTKGMRIKKRREELGIGQTDLAKKVGISKQSLYKYEKDIITNIPTDIIEKLAYSLDTTPAYLMGWEDELTQEVFEESFQNSGEASRLAYYFNMMSKLSPNSQKEVFNFIDYQVKKHEPEED